MIRHLLRHDSLTKSVIGDLVSHIEKGRPRILQQTNQTIEDIEKIYIPWGQNV